MSGDFILKLNAALNIAVYRYMVGYFFTKSYRCLLILLLTFPTTIDVSINSSSSLQQQKILLKEHKKNLIKIFKLLYANSHNNKVKS